MYRNETPITDGADGLSGDEGVFIACPFWFVDNLVLIGRHEGARAMFERPASLVTDLGFLAEEYDVRTGRLIGNSPKPSRISR